MLSMLLISGAVALILFGIRFLRKGLDRLFGAQLGIWMQRLAKDRYRGFLAGLFVSICSPSSTTIAVLNMQTILEGMLTPKQALAIALGANIGLTVTALMIGLKIQSFAPILIGIGVILFQYTRSNRSRGIGQVVLSIGLIFLAVYLIEQYVSGFIQHTSPDSDIFKLIKIAENHPLWMAGIAALLTVLLQSSTATIALIIGLMAGGVSSIEIAFPAVLGTNIGLMITMLIIGWRQTEARRMAMSNFILKLGLSIVLLVYQDQAIALLTKIPGDIAQHITYAHTGFNILVALIGMPLLSPLYALTEKLVPPVPTEKKDTFGPRYIQNNPGDNAALALGQSQREITRVSEMVRQMLDDLWIALSTNDEIKARDIAKIDDQVDFLDARIKRYLAQLGSEVDGVANSREQINQLTYLTELESIGDIIDKNLTELVLKKIKLQVQFSEQGWQELNDFYQKVAQNLLIADTAFVTRDRLLAQQLLRHKEYIRKYEQELRDRHFARLNARMTQSHETSAIHLDILTHLKRINSGVSHVGYSILLDDPDTADNREIRASIE